VKGGSGNLIGRILRHEQGVSMKLLLVFFVCAVLSGCGIVGGMISGMGQDLQKAGDWMRKK